MTIIKVIRVASIVKTSMKIFEKSESTKFAGLDSNIRRNFIFKRRNVVFDKELKQQILLTRKYLLMDTLKDPKKTLKKNVLSIIKEEGNLNLKR